MSSNPTHIKFSQSSSQVPESSTGRFPPTDFRSFFPRLEIIINSDAMVEDCQKQMSTRQNIRKKFLLLFEICAIVSITTFTHSTLTIYFTLVREHKVRHKKEIPTGICFELKSCLCLLHPFGVDTIKYQLITG